MQMVLLVREAMLARRPHKLTRLREEAEVRGHAVQHVDLGDLKVVCRSSRCEVMWRGGPFPACDVVYWAFDWDDREAWDLVRAVDEAGLPLYMPSNVPMSDKVSQAFLLAKGGVTIPETQVVSLAMLARTEVAFPKVMKGRYGARGELVRWVTGIAEVEAAAGEMKLPENEPFVLQEPVLPLGRDVRAFVIGGEVAAAMVRTAVAGEFRANFSVGGQVQETTLDAAEEAMVLRAAAVFGAPHAGVDFMRSEHGPVVLEVNMWPGLEGIEQATGRNMARLLVEEMEGRFGKR